MYRVTANTRAAAFVAAVLLWFVPQPAQAFDFHNNRITHAAATHFYAHAWDTAVVEHGDTVWDYCRELLLAYGVNDGSQVRACISAVATENNTSIWDINGIYPGDKLLLPVRPAVATAATAEEAGVAVAILRDRVDAIRVDLEGEIDEVVADVMALQNNVVTITTVRETVSLLTSELSDRVDAAILHVNALTEDVRVAYGNRISALEREEAARNARIEAVENRLKEMNTASAAVLAAHGDRLTDAEVRLTDLESDVSALPPDTISAAPAEPVGSSWSDWHLWLLGALLLAVLTLAVLLMFVWPRRKHRAPTAYEKKKTGEEKWKIGEERTYRVTLKDGSVHDEQIKCMGQSKEDPSQYLWRTQYHAGGVLEQNLANHFKKRLN